MDLINNAEEKIKLAKDILNSLVDINIDGIFKLQSKIKQEINFLEKVLHKNNKCDKTLKHFALTSNVCPFFFSV